MLPKLNGLVHNMPEYCQLEAGAMCVDLNGFAPFCTLAFQQRVSKGAKIVLKRQTGMAKEAYELQITPAGVTVEASCEQGIILALTTAAQLKDHKDRLPCGKWQDAPRYSHRGLLLDCVRHFFPVSEVKRIIEQMSLVKMNVLHWMLTNDQGWRIESTRFPKLQEVSGDYYTQAQIRDIVDYAAARGIEVIPEVNMPGHITALLAAYPEYSCFGESVQLATTGGIYPIILCAGKEKTYTLIEELLDEVCELFPSKRIHIGGDEAPKREWKKCPVCQQKMQDEGLKSESALQGYFMNRVIAMLQKHGKQAICWNESLMGGNLSKNAMIQYWTVDQAESVKAFVEAGGQLIYSDMFSFYFDYPHVNTPLNRVYSDALVVDDMNVTDKVFGMECCMWTEHTKSCEAMEKLLFPRLYAFAEAAWSKEKNYTDFVNRLKVFLAAHHPQEIALTPETEREADMPDRMQRVFAHMQSITAAMSEEARAATMEAVAPTEAFQKRFAECFLGMKK